MRALLTQSSFFVIQSSLKDKRLRNGNGMPVITAKDDCLNNFDTDLSDKNNQHGLTFSNAKCHLLIITKHLFFP